LSARLGAVRERLLCELAHFEAQVDFSEDELPDERLPAHVAALEAIASELVRMLEGFAAARRWCEGHRVVLAGRPNVGKSSLINALLGSNRMIVSDEPGTTRDSVDETVDLGGMAFLLTDTAGVRETSSRAEADAVARARERAEIADILAVILDASAPLQAQDRELLSGSAGRRRVVVLNKIDLPRASGIEEIAAYVSAGEQIVELSAHTGAGCARLVDVLVALAREDAEASAAEPTISRVRHRSALSRAHGAVRSAIDIVRSEGGAELIALELRSALHELASITDPVDNEHVLDRIFRDFCIGK
jgi:tRNA modification GTPase